MAAPADLKVVGMDPRRMRADLRDFEHNVFQGSAAKQGRLEARCRRLERGIEELAGMGRSIGEAAIEALL